MKVRKNYSVILRSLVLVLVFALSIINFPVNALTAFAASGDSIDADYNYMTFSMVEKDNNVKTGQKYKLPKAYLGGKESLEIGSIEANQQVSNGGKTATVTASSVSVMYGAANNGDPVTVTSGEFEANKEGNYYVTYSYTYTTEGSEDPIVSSYDFVVTSSLSSASINFTSNKGAFLPSEIDLNLVKKQNNGELKPLVLPIPEIKGEDDEVIDDVVMATTKTATGHCVVVSATAGDGKSIDLQPGKDEDAGKFYIDKAEFERTAGKYTVRYEYYDDGQFVTYATKDIQVYAESAEHYKDYKLDLRVSSFPTTAQTRTEVEIPVPTGATEESKTTPVNDKVDVSYSVEVRYRKDGGKYQSLNKLDGNPYASVLEADGTLKDPTTFKPLEDGEYTFIYTIEDFHGFVDSSDEGVYVLTVDDTQNPQAIVYDASEFTVVEGKKVYTYEDATYKLASNANPESVIVYAVGIKDNYSENGDEDIELSRIITTSTDDKKEIKYYNNYNLIFNYKGYNGLKTNNYLVGKAVDKYNAANAGKEINDDVKMVAWLKDNGYLIVIDNGNVDKIYDLFKDNIKDVFGQEFATSDALKTWLVEKYATAEGRDEIAKLGFAYLDCDETFGEIKDDTRKGMGTGTYYIYYMAVDSSGNKTPRSSDNSKRIYIASYTDAEMPTIEFKDTFAKTYEPTEKITFTKPSATDTSDRSMKTRTAYRYLKAGAEKDEVIKFTDAEGNEIPESELVDLDEVFTDLGKGFEDGELQKERFKDYNDATAHDGYMELIDEESEKFTIDLNEAPADATKLQIIAWTYDDYGNSNVNGSTIEIIRTNDTKAPILRDAKLPEVADKLLSGDEVTLPTIKVADDLVSHLTYDVVVKCYGEDGVQDVDVYGYKATVKGNHDGSGVYEVFGGYFETSFAGKYQASIIVSDYRKDAIIYNTTYDVQGRDYIYDLKFFNPTMNADLESQTIEIDEPKEIEIPTPVINYNIENSITYDEFLKDPETSKKFVLIGVDAENKPTTMGLTSSHTPGTKFTPTLKDVGKDVDIWFDVDLKIYDHTKFTYVDGKYDEAYTDGGYFTNAEFEKARFYLEKEDEIVYATTAESSETRKYIFKLEKEVSEDKKTVTESVKIYQYADPTELATDASELEGKVKDIFDSIRVYNLHAGTYVIKVQDKKGPTIKSHNYAEQMTSEDLQKQLNSDAAALVLDGLEVYDASGIDYSDRTELRITWTPVNTKNGTENSYKTYKASEFIGTDIKFAKDRFNTVFDGVIKLDATIYDKAGNSSTFTHSIKIGDNEAPTVTYPDKWLAESYQIGSELTVDLTKLDCKDNKGLGDNKPQVKLTLAGNEVEATEGSNDDVKVYKLDTVGTYSLEITLSDAVGNKFTDTKTINVTARATNTAMTYQIVGTVLIVISVLVLAGVIVYFIVSKVKLDKELKK